MTNQKIINWLKRTKRDDAQYITWTLLSEVAGKPVSFEETDQLGLEGYLARLAIVREQLIAGEDVDWTNGTCVDPDSGDIIQLDDGSIIFAAGPHPDVGSEYQEPVDKDALIAELVAALEAVARWLETNTKAMDAGGSAAIDRAVHKALAKANGEGEQ